MKGKFRPKFTNAETEKFLKDKMERIQEAVLLAVQKVGEDFVTNARNMGAYKDQTGNLRSSTGYVIIKDGLQYTSGGFVKIRVNAIAKKKKKPKKAANASDVIESAVESSGGKVATIINGPEAGKDLAKTIQKENAEKFKKGIFLIGVAGKEYAIHVEAKGKDVITGSSTIAIKQLTESLERIRTKVLGRA
jgi:hypothetical protein